MTPHLSSSLFRVNPDIILEGMFHRHVITLAAECLPNAKALAKLQTRLHWGLTLRGTPLVEPQGQTKNKLSHLCARSRWPCQSLLCSTSQQGKDGALLHLFHRQMEIEVHRVSSVVPAEIESESSFASTWLSAAAFYTILPL